jgi:TolA-binding protein
MKIALRGVVLLLTLTAVGALAQDKKQMTPAQMSQVKSMAMKERQYMMDKTKAAAAQVADIQKSVSTMQGDKAKSLQGQVADLQSTIKALETQLAKTPKYFDDPLSDPLHDTP